MTIIATLKAGREKPVRHGHPWVFSGAIDSWSRPAPAGAAVDVVSAGGEWLARGLAEGGKNLAVRIYTRRENEQLDGDFFAAKLRSAIAWREREVFAQEPDTDSFRLCFSEADGLSGLIIDRYRDKAVIIAEDILKPFIPSFGLSTKIDAPIRINESGFTYEVDTGGGQKTGFYLDQRINRRRVASYARGRRVLSCYCYTGGFEVHAAHAGATSVRGIDSSAPAIEQARRNQALNPGGVPVDYMAGDVPGFLRKCRDRAETFDLIILDPPKFVNSQAQIEKGLRAYKDINLLAMKLLAPDGILATFSCSGWVKRDDFTKALAWAALDAGREVQMLEHLGQPPDHPVSTVFPESDYLCGVIARVA